MWPFRSRAKKTGFGYVAPEIERNRAIFNLVIETALIGVVVILIFGILNYFSIFPLYKISPRLFSWLPTLTPKSATTNNPTNKEAKLPVALDAEVYKVDKSVVPEVEVVSDAPTMTLTITDKAKFTEFVNQYDIFGRKYYMPNQQFSEVLKKLVIHLTDKVQPANKYFLLGKDPVTSTSIDFQGNTYHLYISLSDEAFTNKSYSPEVFFTQSLLGVTYRMSYNPGGNRLNSGKEQELLALQQKISKSTPMYITIVRKSDSNNK